MRAEKARARGEEQRAARRGRREEGISGAGTRRGGARGGSAGSPVPGDQPGCGWQDGAETSPAPEALPCWELLTLPGEAEGLPAPVGMGARGCARRHPVCCVLHPPASPWVSWSWQPDRLLQPSPPRRGQAVSAATICSAVRALRALHRGSQSLAQNACGTVPPRCPSAWCRGERTDGRCGVPELSWCSPCPGGTRPRALQGPSSSKPTLLFAGFGTAVVRAMTPAEPSWRAVDHLVLHIPAGRREPLLPPGDGVQALCQ